MTGSMPSLPLSEATSASSDRSSGDVSSGWGLKGLTDFIWSSETQTPKDNTDVRPQAVSPFASLFGSANGAAETDSAATQQQQHQQQSHEGSQAELNHHQSSSSSSSSSRHDAVQSHAVADDATQTDLGSDDEDDLAAETSHQENADAGSEDEWEEDQNSTEPPSFSELLSRCWYGNSTSDLGSPAPKPRHRKRLLKRNSSLNRSRQLSLTRKKADSSWFSGWVPKSLRVPSVFNRSDSWRAKPFTMKLAEQVIGEGAAAAVELVQRDILESGEPLPEATIKFFVKAAAGVASGWANDNLNQVFFAFGAYVAATCGAMHLTKKALKWFARRLPFGGKKKIAPVVAFATDVMLPTSFFGPWLATYIIAKIIMKENARIKAAVRAVKVAKKAGADKDTIVSAAIGAAVEPDSAIKQYQLQKAEKKRLKAERAEAEKQQNAKQKQKQQLYATRMHSFRRSGSITARGGGGRMRAAFRPRSHFVARRGSSATASLMANGAMHTQSSGDVWGIRED